MSVHFSNLYGIFKNSSYHVSKEKTSAQRQKRTKPLLSFCHSQQLKAWRPTGGRRHAVLMLFGEYPQKSVVDAAVKFSPQAIEVGHIFRIGADHQCPLPYGRGTHGVGCHNQRLPTAAGYRTGWPAAAPALTKKSRKFSKPGGFTKRILLFPLCTFAAIRTLF